MSAPLTTAEAVAATERAALAAALDPRSVAVIGASNDPDKIGGRPLDYLGRHGFRGSVYPINPNRDTVQGRAAFPDLDALPEAPDAVVIAVAGDDAVRAVEACAARGVKVAVVMTSGFGEVDADGRAKEAHMRAVARAAGMRVVGPNSQGLANFGTGAILSFSTMFVEVEPLDGPIAIISQSGGMSVVPWGLLRRRGLGIRHVHATGNDADVSAAELASVVAEDPELALLLLYVEKIEDPQSIADLGRIAAERGLPVIAMKGGSTPAGQEASLSHTGALATEDRVVDALFERHGIWRVQTTKEMICAAELFLKGWKPRGKRLVVISNGGAACVMGADAAERARLPLAALSAKTRSSLQAVLPAFATVTNPIDITAALLTNSRLFSEVLPIVAGDGSTDAVLVSVPVAGRGYDVDTFALDTGEFARNLKRPVVVAAPQPSVAERFRRQGLPVFDTEAEAVDALAQFIGQFELQQRASGVPTPAMQRQPAYADSHLIDEAAALALAARHGVPVVDHHLCTTADEAVAEFAALGSPVAVKGCSDSVVHKSEAGLVILGVRDAAGVRSAYAQLQTHTPCSVLVQRLARGHELMIGGRLDPVFGPLVLVGQGGAYVEALPDIRALLWPFAEQDVLDALTRLRIAPVLAGVRGEPATDVAAFARAAVSVGRMLADEGAKISAIELNPVIADERGCVAVDAVAYLR